MHPRPPLDPPLSVAISEFVRISEVTQFYDGSKSTKMCDKRNMASLVV